MATIKVQRHQTIRKLVTQRPDAIVDVTIDLWQRMASELVSIIGEGGFQSLYSRSVHLASATFPWIVLTHPWQRTDSRFPDLKVSFEGRDLIEVSEASIALLIIFSDILAVLIGDILTTGILGSAWGIGALDIADKEIL